MSVGQTNKVNKGTVEAKICSGIKVFDHTLQYHSNILSTIYDSNSNTVSFHM